MALDDVAREVAQQDLVEGIGRDLRHAADAMAGDDLAGGPREALARLAAALCLRFAAEGGAGVTPGEGRAAEAVERLVAHPVAAFARDGAEDGALRARVLLRMVGSIAAGAEGDHLRACLGRADGA